MTTATTNGIQLHKEHAIIHTGAINVKILRLDKRQLTQSVFRQLDHESIFLHDGTLRGTPWGRVNYTWKGNRAGTAFHVIWQDGDYIKRSPVPSAGRVQRDWFEEDGWRSWLFDDVNTNLICPPADPGWDIMAKWFVGAMEDFSRQLDKRDSRIQEVTKNLAAAKAQSVSEMFVVVHKNKLAELREEKFRWGEYCLDYDWRDRLAPRIRAIMPECPVAKPLDKNPNLGGFSCDFADKDRLFAFLEESARKAESKHQEWQAACAKCKDNEKHFKGLLLQQVEAMKRLDQLFIAV